MTDIHVEKENIAKKINDKGYTENSRFILWFQVLRAALQKIQVFWKIMPRPLLNAYGRFKAAYAYVVRVMQRFFFDCLIHSTRSNFPENVNLQSQYVSCMITSQV
jgi:hypothetical protein